MQLTGRHIAMVFAALPALAWPQLVLAQAARVVSVQGTAVLERAGQPPRVLAAGEVVEQKDVINVAQKSHAMLEFTDKSKVTLRPNTVFRVESYADKGPQQGMVLGLIKGGLRANTGDLSKNNPNAVRVQTETIVLGIRGTDFDARLCTDDCGPEQRARPVPSATANAAARVIEMRGTVAATLPNSPPRDLAEGAAVFEREGIVTGPDSYAVIAFRDGSRITLAQRAHLAVSRFDYDSRAPRRGHAHLKLVAGNAHVWTGELAKASPDAFLFETDAGMISTRGAGFSVSGPTSAKPAPARPSAERRLDLAMNRANTIVDADHRANGFVLAASGGEAAPGADEVLVVHTWDGTVVIQTATERIEVKSSESVAFAIIDGKLTVLQKPPPQFQDNVPLPNTVNVDPSALPGQQSSSPEAGLYVWVREGVVVMGKDNEAFEIKAGNAALATPNRLALLNAVPGFMLNDPTPRFPGPTNLNFVPRAFKAPDGSISRTCR